MTSALHADAAGAPMPRLQDLPQPACPLQRLCRLYFLSHLPGLLKP
jgi:hypothetical protein